MTNGIRFEWDPHKAAANVREHDGISFELAQLVFEDELQERSYRGNEHGEERWWTMGMVGSTVLVVVHTWIENDGEKEDIIRIISARRATASERRRYEEG